MIVTIEQLQAAIIKFVDLEIAPKANSITKFMVYFYVPSLPKLIASKLDEIKSSGIMSDLFTDEGNIKLDEAYQRAKSAMEKSGSVLIPKINYFVDNSDVDKLYQIIKNL